MIDIDPIKDYYSLGEVSKMLESRRMRQIFQTVTVRLERGLKGPPDSYTEEEKKYYAETEKGILKDREEGFTGTYGFPNDYD